MKRLAVTIFLILSAPVAYGARAPYQGLINGVSDNDAILYFCETGPQETVQCDFNQMKVRKAKTKAEVLEEGQRSLDAWDDPEKEKELAQMFNKTACDEATEFLAILETEKIDSDFEKRTRGRNSKDNLAYEMLRLRKFTEICEDPSRKNWESLVGVQAAKELNTCEVSSITWQRTLKKVAGADVWYVQEKPRNVCGTLDVSRFQLNKETDLWEYFSQKKVLNPEKEITPGTKCAQLDENEYRYAHLLYADVKLDCDWINFSPL